MTTTIQTTIKRSLIAVLTQFNRRLIALLLSFMVSASIVPLNAQTYTDLDRAITATIARQKPMMIVVMQTTCPYCKQFYDHTLNAEGVMARLSQEFVIYESYLDRGGVFPTDFEWTGTVPTTYFVTPTGELIGQPLVGVIPLDQFIPYVSQVLEYFYQSREAALRERIGR